MKKKMSFDSLSCHHYIYFIFICFVFLIQLLTHFRLFSWTRESYECSEIKRFAPFAVAKAIPTDTELTNHIFVQKHLPHFELKKQKKINKIGTKKYNTILERFH